MSVRNRAARFFEKVLVSFRIREARNRLLPLGLLAVRRRLNQLRPSLLRTFVVSSATRVFQARKFFSGVSQLLLVGPVQRIRCGTPEPRDLLDRVALSLIVRRGVKKVAVVTHCFVPSSSTGLLSNDLAVISAQSPAAYIRVLRRQFHSQGVCFGRPWMRTRSAFPAEASRGSA